MLTRDLREHLHCSRSISEQSPNNVCFIVLISAALSSFKLLFMVSFWLKHCLGRHIHPLPYGLLELKAKCVPYWEPCLWFRTNVPNFCFSESWWAKNHCAACFVFQPKHPCDSLRDGLSASDCRQLCCKSEVRSFLPLKQVLMCFNGTGPPK